VGFETLSPDNLHQSNKPQNLGREYARVTERLRNLGIMINGSFVFGLDDDRPDVFERTVDWAVNQGLTTATFHILTPYPGTRLYAQMQEQGRLLHSNWDLYDTRHVVYRPRSLSSEALVAGYWRAYRDFYSFRNIARASSAQPSASRRAQHFLYATGWKKFEPLWNAAINARRLTQARPLLEGILAHRRRSSQRDVTERGAALNAPERRFLEVVQEEAALSVAQL
jgi:radical SAM superfamily enzyme YgiQ (UPF0313 family)